MNERIRKVAAGLMVRALEQLEDELESVVYDDATAVHAELEAYWNSIQILMALDQYSFLLIQEKYTDDVLAMVNQLGLARGEAEEGTSEEAE